MWDLIQFDCCPCRKRILGHRHRGKALGGHRENAAICKPREASEDTNSVDICMWTSSLKNCEKINFCFLNHSVLCYGSLSKIIPMVQSLSCVRLFATPWIAACQASLSSNSQSLLKLMSIELVMPSRHHILCHLLLLPPFHLSQHQGFSSESALLIRWPKYWSFSFSISPSNEYSGLISFRMDWLDFPAVQGTLKSLL